MRWKDKRTDVVENAANAILESLKEHIEQHHAAVAAVRRVLQEGERRRG